jgi:hypothetical protein
MPLDLVIPHLLLPADAPPRLRQARLAFLEKWLARADLASQAADGSLAWIANAYGLAAPAPYGAIALEGEGLGADGHWLRADPVHLRVAEDGVILHDAAILDVTRAEAESLVATLQAHFAGDGLELRAAAPDRWYLRVPPGELPVTVPLEKAFGRNVFGLLPKGTGRINWPSALTEAQMVMGPHGVNERREGAQPAINSVWLWGEGSRPAAVERRYALVYANETFTRGLGRLSQAEVRPLPQAIAEIDLVREGDSTLVMLDILAKPLHRADEGAWLAAAEALEQKWFLDLGDAIARFGAVRLILPAEGRTRIATLTPSVKWRWFRPRKPLIAHA